MILAKKEIIGLPVFTQSNQYLGKICDFELDTATQKIARYHVKSEQLIKGILADKLIIAVEQVFSIDREKMVVLDSVKREKNRAYEARPIPA